jgi:hypothetical protein
MPARSASSSRRRLSSHFSGSISTSPIGASVIIAALSRQYASTYSSGQAPVKPKIS